MRAGHALQTTLQVYPAIRDHDPRIQAPMQLRGLPRPRPYPQSLPSTLGLILRYARNPPSSHHLRHILHLPEVRYHLPGREIYYLARSVLSEIALQREGPILHWLRAYPHNLDSWPSLAMASYHRD